MIIMCCLLEINPPKNPTDPSGRQTNVHLCWVWKTQKHHWAWRSLSLWNKQHNKKRVQNCLNLLFYGNCCKVSVSCDDRPFLQTLSSLIKDMLCYVNDKLWAAKTSKQEKSSSSLSVCLPLNKVKCGPMGYHHSKEPPRAPTASTTVLKFLSSCFKVPSSARAVLQMATNLSLNNPVCAPLCPRATSNHLINTLLMPPLSPPAELRPTRSRSSADPSLSATAPTTSLTEAPTGTRIVV